MADDPEQKSRSATTLVREWIRDRTDPVERGRTPALAEECVAWLQTNPDLLDRFLYEQVYNTAAELVRAVMLASRRTRRFKEMADASEEDRRNALRAWFDRMEHVSPAIGYVRLGAMTKDELLTGAQERETRAGNDLTSARWFRTLASGLEEGQSVEDRYTSRQVEAAHEQSREHINANLDGILAGVDDVMRRILRRDLGDNGPVNGR